MSAYYSEHDPFAAAWLRELIKAGHIAPGDVDERDLWDVTPDDLAGYTQVHFCAGIGVWSHALRQAGWPDDRPVWTASFPCQPFSAAGKRAGFTDERHLWPAGFHLIRECRPELVFGEQVSSKDGLAWIDVVFSDLENEAYTVAALDICAAGVGAPHIRQRLYWVAEASGVGQRGRGRCEAGARPETIERLGRFCDAAPCGDKWCNWLGCQEDISCDILGHADDAGSSATGVVGDPNIAGPQGLPELVGTGSGERAAGPAGAAGGMDNTAGPRCYGARTGAESEARDEARLRGPKRGCAVGGVANPEHAERRAIMLDGSNGCNGQDSGRAEAHGEPGARSEVRQWPGAVNGFWRDADWLLCRDGRWRPVSAGTFPLATRTPARVGRLRGFGNALSAPVATAFIETYLETER